MTTDNSVWASLGMDILEVDFCNRVAQCGFSSGDFVGSVMTLGAKMANVLADSHHHKTMQCKPWHDSIFIICWSFPGLGNHYMPRLHISSPQSIIQKPKSQESKIQIPKSKSLNSNPTTKYKFMWNHADSKNM